MFEQQVLSFILGTKISKIIFEAAKIAFSDKMLDFSHALNGLKFAPISFFRVDPLFENNIKALKEHQLELLVPSKNEDKAEELVLEFSLEKSIA